VDGEVGLKDKGTAAVVQCARLGASASWASLTVESGGVVNAVKSLVRTTYEALHRWIVDTGCHRRQIRSGFHRNKLRDLGKLGNEKQMDMNDLADGSRGGGLRKP